MHMCVFGLCNIWDCCEGKSQTAALTSGHGNWGRTLNRATEWRGEHVCVCVCVFWGWDGLTGSCEKKYDCSSEVDCRCRRGKTAPPCPRCSVSPQQSVMQVEQTRWLGKDLDNRALVSGWLYCLYLSRWHAQSHACSMSAEDKSLCWSPEKSQRAFLWRLTLTARVIYIHACTYTHTHTNTHTHTHTVRALSSEHCVLNGDICRHLLNHKLPSVCCIGDTLYMLGDLYSGLFSKPVGTCHATHSCLASRWWCHHITWQLLFKRRAKSQYVERTMKLGGIILFVRTHKPAVSPVRTLD